MPQTKASILMLTYHRPRMIARAISSLCNQSFADWELIIVQDGFNPDTDGILREWLARDSRIRYYPRSTTGTIAEASNFGLSRAQGEYVAILDDDDYWISDDKLQRQVDFLDRNPDYVACGGGYVLIDEQESPLGMYLKPECDADIRARALLANPIANSTALFRRVINGEPVRYDTTIRQFADWDFWLSLGAMGKLYNFPDYMAHYALWDGGSSFRNQRSNAQAAIRIVCKHRREYGGFALAIVLAWLYFCYACLPASVRRISYETLSALKKGLASSRPGPASMIT
jgi:glycosyltransferase involved in cell wall biosynthesis